MHFNTIYSILAVVAFVQAAPTSPGYNETVEIFQRADSTPVECGPDNDKRAWPLQSVQAAYNTLVFYDHQGKAKFPKAGTRPYPQQYGNTRAEPRDPDVAAALKKIPGCGPQTGYKLYEFPLTDPEFRGGVQGSQGPDRVIAIAKNAGQGGQRAFTYCMAITHRGGTGSGDPSFRPCKSV